MPIPEALQGDTWTKITARNSFPLLVWCAQHGRTIAYGHLDRELVRRGIGHHVHAAAYGYPAGAIGNALIETEQELGITIPPLNALVVEKTTRLPGDGCDYYLNRYVRGGNRRKLTDEDHKALAEQSQDDIFNYRDWDKILQLYDMAPIVDEIPIEPHEELEGFSPPVGGWGSGGESEAHKLLKKYVRDNPQLIFKNRKGWMATIEYPLPSGDCVDVFFEGHGRLVAVEVKSIISNDNDLSRGIFQCVKYRAVTRAWQKTLQNIPNGNAVLVIQRPLPISLQQVADLLNVEVIVLDVER